MKGSCGLACPTAWYHGLEVVGVEGWASFVSLLHSPLILDLIQFILGFIGRLVEILGESDLLGHLFLLRSCRLLLSMS